MQSLHDDTSLDHDAKICRLCSPCRGSRPGRLYGAGAKLQHTEPSDVLGRWCAIDTKLYFPSTELDEEKYIDSSCPIIWAFFIRNIFSSWVVFSYHEKLDLLISSASFTMRSSVLHLISSLASLVISTCTPNDTSTENPTSPALSTNSYVGQTMQATVTGYGDCLTEAMACGLSGSPGKDPTAAMSAYLIPHNDGVCGSCWKLSNIRGLDYSLSGVPPKIGAPFDSDAEGMVVLVNNACSPGADQYQAGAVGQCAQEHEGEGGADKLGSETVLDLCAETDAVVRIWNQTKPGMAVADLVGVPCEEWTGTVRKVPW